MTTFTQHLRHAIRSLRRSPAFTITVIATLGIGIGLNAAIFTVVDCVLLRPLGYRDADRIVGIQTHFTDENRSIARIGGDDYVDLASQVHGFEATAFYQGGWSDGLTIHGTADYLPLAWVSPRFGEVMGVEPVAGRLFNGGDTEGHEALVSAAFARQHFGSAALAVGQPLTYNGRVRTIAGVLPDGFTFPQKTQVWIESGPRPETPNRTAYNQRAVGKRRAGTTPAQLAAELGTFSSRLQHLYKEDTFKSIETEPLQQQIVGKIRPTLNLLMGSVAVILLIICANIMHLHLVRAMQQLRGITIRTALGATRTALAIRSLIEAALLAFAGAITAAAIAVPALKLMVRLAPPEFPRLAEVSLNADVFAFSLLVALAVMAVTAMLPVWRSWHVDPALALRQDASRGTESRRSMKMRDSLIVAEVALTLTLSVVAILLTRQLIAQSRQDLGFDATSLVTLDAHAVETTPWPDFPKDSSPAALELYRAAAAPVGLGRMARLNDAMQTLAATPGILSVAAIDGAPMGFGGSDVGYAVEGRQVFAPPFKGLPEADIRPVTPNVFATLGVPLLRGRALDANDGPGAPTVLEINQALAQAIFPGQDPIGKRIMCGFDDKSAWWTIVGVVGDIRSDSPADKPSPTFYIPFAQHPATAGNVQFLVRTALAPTTMLDSLGKTLHRSHPEFAVEATTMRQNVGETQHADHFRSLLFTAFAAVSILLAAVGMYGVTSYTVAQRRFEFSLRIALGAGRNQLLGMVLRKALGLAALGIALGVGLWLALARVLASTLGNLPAFEAPSYLLAALAVLIVALLATALPARAAANANPMTILRSE